MSINNNNNNNNNNKERRKVSPSSPVSRGLGAFAIASMLIAAGSCFAFIGSIKEPMTTAYAQEGENNSANSAIDNTTTTTTTTNTSQVIKLSPQPILQERTTTVSQTPINQTHVAATFTGNGTLILPSTTETINFTTNGSALISLDTHSTQAKESIVTEQGETADATFYEILKMDPATGDYGKGLVMAVIHTNSTGMLAPLNDTIVAGTTDFQSNEVNSVTLWQWESGIGSNVSGAPFP